MQSHTQINRLFESPTVPELKSFEEYKSYILSLKQSIGSIRKVAEENKQSAETSESIINGLFASIKACEKHYSEYSSRHVKEKYSTVIIAKKERNQDILELSAAVICCVPSYILTFCHCCLMIPFCELNLSEIADSSFCHSTEVCPQTNFFFKPLAVIKEKYDDIATSNEMIKTFVTSIEKQDEDEYKPAPRPQVMG